MEVHGKFNSFAELGRAMKIKSKKKIEKSVKCPVCGGMMNKVAENTWICPFNKLTTEKLIKNGVETEVQVFGECGNVLIVNPYSG